jgi:FkbM family methyltransferase
MSKNSIDKLKVFLSGIPVLRWMVLKLLKFISRDITIHNPYTGDRLLLNLYRHKGYWYFGRSRERATMEKFRQLIPPGSNVVEIGGHIGFISQFFSMLVGEAGKVIVFEPGSNNLTYTEANLKSKNIQLVKKAVSDKLGEAIFYEDNITGQNNSLLSDYKNADSVSKTHSEKLEKHKTVVQVTTLDNYLDENDLTCDFIKIDIEGFELNALRGMPKTLQKCKSLMIEVTENQEEVSKILITNSFGIEDEEGNKMVDIPRTFNGNIFALKLN